jgi:hypothetical protein
MFDNSAEPLLTLKLLSFALSPLSKMYQLIMFGVIMLPPIRSVIPSLLPVTMLLITVLLIVPEFSRRMP